MTQNKLHACVRMYCMPRCRSDAKWTFSLLPDRVIRLSRVTWRYSHGLSHGSETFPGFGISQHGSCPTGLDFCLARSWSSAAGCTQATCTSNKRSSTVYEYCCMQDRYLSRPVPVPHNLYRHCRHSCSLYGGVADAVKTPQYTAIAAERP